MKYKKNLLLMNTAFSVCSISLASASSETMPAPATVPVSEGIDKQSGLRAGLDVELTSE